MNTQKLLEFLETYKGRDRILRLLCYASKCGAGLTSEKLSLQLDNFSRQLSSSRAVFRLLNDLPAFVYAVKFGTGNESQPKLHRFLEVIGNVVDVIFCPIDHIAWAMDRKIISSKNVVFWDTLNTALWVASLYLSIMSDLTRLSSVLDEKSKLLERGRRDSDAFKRLVQTQEKVTMNTFRSALDVIFAVNYLPSGFLWAGTLSKWQVGALGTFSSIIALYQCLI